MSEVERQAFQTAIAPLPQNPAAAKAALTQFLDDYPKSRLADDATEELARIALLEGRPHEAFQLLYQIIENQPNGNRVDSVRVRLARWENERGRADTARTLLGQVSEERLDRLDRIAFYNLRASLAEDSTERVLDLADLRRALWAERSALKRDGARAAVLERLQHRIDGVDQVIDGIMLGMTHEELETARKSLGEAVPGGRIVLVLASRAWVRGDLAEADALLAEVSEYTLTTADEKRLVTLRSQVAVVADRRARLLPTFAEATRRTWPDLDGVEGTVGVVLPLSGRYAPFGQAALRGVLLAADVFEVGSLEPIPNALFDPVPDVSAVAPEAAPVMGPTTGHGDAPGELIKAPIEPTELASLSGQESQTAHQPRSPSDREDKRSEPYRDGRPVSPQGAHLQVRDSKGDPDTAAAAVLELAADPEIVAVIGPIFSAEALAAAHEAERWELPLVTLSNREEVASNHGSVFRVRITPEDEVRDLVRYAADQKGALNFAVLYPKSRYGTGMRNRYWKAVLDEGGRIVASADYDPEATDFNAPIRSLVGFELLTSDEEIALDERARAIRRGRRLEPENALLLNRILYDLVGPEGELLPPRVDFDALFIPDGYENIQLIAPQLAFHEIEGVQLLGSSQWNEPELLRIARKHVDGAVISTPFDLRSDFPSVQEFVETYRTTFGNDPEGFSAVGYDAMNLILTQLALGRASRTQLREGLLRIHGFPGVSGVSTILPDGNALKRPFLLEFKRGKTRRVLEKPQPAESSHP